MSSNEMSNEISEYWDWLTRLDERAREVILSHDDEMVTGRMSRLEFDGQLEFKLFLKAENKDDFINLYASVNRRTYYDVKKEAGRIWNISMAVMKHTADEIQKALDEARKEIENETR